MMGRAAEKIAKIERLQRRGERHHDLNDEPQRDNLLEAMLHD